jgi:sugar/nucleoside kinase (ribokinase family)
MGTAGDLVDRGALFTMKAKKLNGAKSGRRGKSTLRLPVSDDDHVVLGTGLMALDIVVGPHSTSVPRYWVGGTCGNVLTILAYLGWCAYPAVCLGEDVAADLIVEDLRRFGVQLRFLSRIAGRRTPIIVEKIRLAPDGTPRHRFTWICPGCGAWFPGYRALGAVQADSIAEDMPNAKLFFFDRVSRTSLTLAKASAKRGALIVFEPNGTKGGRLFQEALQLSHVIKYSQERLGPLRSLDKCKGRKLEIETLGDEGLRYRLLGIAGKAARWVELAPYPITELKDSAGAGDWCTAGILHVLARDGLRGFNQAKSSTIEEALDFGQALAAAKCSYEGPRGIMYSLKKDQLETSINEIQQRQPILRWAGDLKTQTVPEALKGICPSCPEPANVDAYSLKRSALDRTY